jgi:hypothetical protein
MFDCQHKAVQARVAFKKKIATQVAVLLSKVGDVTTKAFGY